MIREIHHHGVLVHDVNFPGEGRADRVAPAHPNGIQLSRRRFLLLISTLAFRGVDDSRSILYQIRDGGFDGPVIREGMLAQSIDDWDPLGDGKRYVRQFGHMTAFGVPRGAVIDGKPAINANVFAIKWRVCAREVAPQGHLLWLSESPDLSRRTQAVEWTQVRLNDRENDLEIIQPARQLRQEGYEHGPRFCEHEHAFNMNQTFVQAVPYKRDRTEWTDVNHFNFGDTDHRGGGAVSKPAQIEYEADCYIAPLRYRFNAATGLYDWVQTGPAMRHGLFEASVAPYHGRWVVAARRRDGGGVAWGQTDDLFARKCVMVDASPMLAPRTPLSLFARPDGVLMMMAGDRETSPYGSGRNPLYAWEIDPDGSFLATNRRTVFDTYVAGVPIPRDHGPLIDMAKLLPHTGGSSQLIMHRVRSVGMLAAEADLGAPAQVLTEDDFQSTAIYYAEVRYTEPYPSMWQFES